MFGSTVHWMGHLSDFDYLLGNLFTLCNSTLPRRNAVLRACWMNLTVNCLIMGLCNSTLAGYDAVLMVCFVSFDRQLSDFNPSKFNLDRLQNSFDGLLRGFDHQLCDFSHQQCNFDRLQHSFGGLLSEFDRQLSDFNPLQPNFGGLLYDLKGRSSIFRPSSSYLSGLYEENRNFLTGIANSCRVLWFPGRI